MGGMTAGTRFISGKVVVPPPLPSATCSPTFLTQREVGVFHESLSKPRALRVLRGGNI